MLEIRITGTNAKELIGNLRDVNELITRWEVVAETQQAAPAEPAIEDKPVMQPAPQAAPEKIAIEDKPEPDTQSDAPVIALEEVRAKLASLSQAGKQAQVKKIITSFGVKKLTDIPAEKFAEVMAKAEEI